MKARISIENNLVIGVKKELPLCLCGCGEKVKKIGNLWIKGHHAPNKGKKFSEKWKQKLSQNCKGMSERKHSEESKQKMKENHRGGTPKGFKSSPVSIEKMSKSLTGRKLSKEHKAKLANNFKGRKHTEKTKNKMKEKCSGKLNSFYGKQHTQETIKKFKERKHTQETIKKIANANIGKKRTLETKKKQSISAIEYIEKHKLNGKRMCPRIGNNEIPIGDQLEIFSSESFLRNDRSMVNECGKFMDLYDKKYNLAIEVLEPHHFKINGELSNNDQNRQLIISYHLSCMVYYISEQEFLKNPEKEIQRFKDFLVLLDQGRN